MNKANGFVLAGLLFLAASLFLTGYNLYDDARADHAAETALEQLRPSLLTQEKLLETNETAIPDYVLDPDVEMPAEEIDGHAYIGVLSIPSLKLELPVSSDWSYSRLKYSPCRYSGTAYQKVFSIMAHNYSRHFGHLKDVAIGDEIVFTDMDGNVFSYQVKGIKTVSPSSIDEVTSGEWDLTLFTCTLGGQYRIVVQCQRILG